MDLTRAKLSDLIAALPEEITADDRLHDIFADLAHRPVPVGAIQRLWTAGGLSVHIALAYFALWIRQWFADAGTRKEREMETNLRVALKMIHRLGYLRGAMAKVGQTLGNLPTVVPADVASTLDRLHAEAPPMHFSLLREMVGNELGGDPDAIFKRFDKDAFAAASIGQVHRARLKTGEEVAVKIQYPGIARTIDADFRSLGALLFPMRLSSEWDATQAQFEEIHRMLTLEADYLHEAESLRQARALFRPEDGIVVPQVYAEYSTARVLTTEYLPGPRLQDFLAANPSQAQRNEFGRKMYVAWWRLYYGSMNYADPHSGNYVFMNDGRLGLLDFGCVQHFTAEEREIIRMSDHFFESLDSLPEFLKRVGFSDQDLANEELMRLTKESIAWMMEPGDVDGPFDFGNEDHWRRGIDWMTRLVVKRYTARAHPMFVYYHRSVFGLKALLLQLRAQIDVKSVIAQERRALSK